MKALRAELLKAFFTPMILVAVIVLIILPPLFGNLRLNLEGYDEKDFSKISSFMLFAYGCSSGLPLAGYFAIAFACMMFAGEFDRGTIKNIFTRPVTRTSIYFAKVATALIVAWIFYFAVLWSSVTWSLVKGETGHVWAQQSYQIRRTYLEILSHTGLAMLMSFLSYTCLVLFGIAISNLVNNSGFAVAAGMISIVILSLGVEMLSSHTKPYLFNYYLGYGFDALSRFARDDSAIRWNPDVIAKNLHVIVSAATAGLFVIISYINFRLKQVTA